MPSIIRKFQSQRFWSRVCVCAALAGAICLAFGFLMTICAYGEGRSESYSVLNHCISELGWMKRSRMAALFNGSLVIGGLSMAPAICALALSVRNKISVIAMLAGVSAGVSASMVGLFPMDKLLPHILAAFAFFISWLISVSLFTLAFFLDKRVKPPLDIRLAGIASSFLALAFLALPKREILAFYLNIDSARRPDLWAVPIFEWLLFASLCAWLLCAMRCLWCGSIRMRCEVPGMERLSNLPD